MKEFTRIKKNFKMSIDYMITNNEMSTRKHINNIMYRYFYREWKW